LDSAERLNRLLSLVYLDCVHHEIPWSNQTITLANIEQASRWAPFLYVLFFRRLKSQHLSHRFLYRMSNLDLIDNIHQDVEALQQEVVQLRRDLTASAKPSLRDVLYRFFDAYSALQLSIN
jgi:hypothetical protein